METENPQGKKNTETELSDLANHTASKLKEETPADIKKVGQIALESHTPTSSRFYKNTYKNEVTPAKKGLKKLPIIIFLIVIACIISAGIFFRHRVNQLLKGPTPQLTQTPAPTAEPTPTPNLLVRLDWSFEVLNGSGVSGQAKKLADKLKSLGYPVVKSGNADKQTYETTELFVKKELQDKINIVIVDLKDIVKIASIAGELKDGTASARIIIGKDLSL